MLNASEPGDGDRELVRAVGIGKTFERAGRRTPALAGVNLTVARGEFVCLLGPSGCGKSTLLNVLAGILPYDEGVAEVNGHRIKGPSAERGMMFQSPMLFPWLTTRENVAFGPKAQRRRSARSQATRDEIDDVLATVGLAGFEEAYPKELSGGMRHRAAFARAIISRPSVLLMDEPFGALDAMTRARMQEFLLDMWERFRITIVFVTHDIEEAILLGDRVCVMGGRPAGIVEDVPIGLTRPRAYEDLETPEFLEIKRRIRRTLMPDDGRGRERARAGAQAKGAHQ
ncbi:MAG: ABC transporter ATP-binding protein [Solirubrobacteraceae bacterium]|jgi:NitT/TauT family transport system ATP-binding protein